MLPKEMFELTLEQKLKLRVIKDEVKECTSMDDLKEQMIKAADLIMHYQSILNVLLKKTIDKDLNDLIEEKRNG